MTMAENILLKVNYLFMLDAYGIYKVTILFTATYMLYYDFAKYVILL